MTPRMAERLTSLLVCRSPFYSSVHFLFYFFRKRKENENRCVDYYSGFNYPFRRRIAGLAMDTCRKIHRRRRAAVLRKEQRNEVDLITLNRRASRPRPKHWSRSTLGNTHADHDAVLKPGTGHGRNECEIAICWGGLTAQMYNLVNNNQIRKLSP